MNGMDNTISSSFPGRTSGFGEAWTVPSDQMVVRRYTSLNYLNDILSNRRLYFRRSDCFEDEGIPTDAALARERQGDKNMDIEGFDFSGGLEGYRANSRKYHHLNCWRMGTDELAWHWDEFGKGDHPIAIESTVGQLRESIECNAKFGMVWYTPSHVTSPTYPPGNFFKKQTKNYRENEFRLVKVDPTFHSIPINGIPGSDPEWYLHDVPDKGIHVNFSLDSVNRIIAHPETTQSSLSLIREKVASFVHDSDLPSGQDPIDVTRSRLDWDNDPGPSCMTYGNRMMTGSPALLTYQIHSEITRTDWQIWDAADVVVITPNYTTDNQHILNTHVEIYRYKSLDNAPNPRDYARSDLKQGLEVDRFYGPSSLSNWIFENNDSRVGFQTKRSAHLSGLPALTVYAKPRLTRYAF